MDYKDIVQDMFMPWKSQPLSSLVELKPYTNKNFTQYMKSNYLSTLSKKQQIDYGEV